MLFAHPRALLSFSLASTAALVWLRALLLGAFTSQYANLWLVKDHASIPYYVLLERPWCY